MSSWKHVISRPPFSFYPATAARRYGYEGLFMATYRHVRELQGCSKPRVRRRVAPGRAIKRASGSRLRGMQACNPAG
jgi:hypothetical protein